MAVPVSFTTIPEMFTKVTAHFRGETRPMFMVKDEGTYTGISFKEYEHLVTRFAGGLASLGIAKGDRVGIIAENRPEWVIADMATISLGAIDVPVYPTLTPSQLEYIFKDSGIKVVIVSNTFQLSKIQKIRQNIPTLEHVIMMTERDLDEAATLGYSHIYAKGDTVLKDNPTLLSDAIAAVTPDDLLTIIYTSGTTGNPKGVMLTHSNMCSNIISSASVIPFTSTDTLLSFLPLCHSFERMAGYYTAMAVGATVAYAESIETVRDNLLEVHPTIVTTVPRLFERIQSRLIKQIDKAPPIRKKIFYWAVEIGREAARARRRGSVPMALKLKHAVADKLVYSKLRERTGGRIRFFVSGGAALPRELGEFFEAVGITIIEGYGLTETSPVLTVNRTDDFKFGTVGKPIPGVDIKIAEDGEILAKGPNIMKGYYNDQKATDEVIDDAGWFHTGDVGLFDAEGHLMITDRKKHLFVSSGGKNIAPQPIENLFIQSKYVEQFVLIGDSRMFCTALIWPDMDSVKEFARQSNLIHVGENELLDQGEVRKLFDEEIEEIQKDLPHFERVRRFEFLPQPLTIEAGEITPTMKVRRRVIEQKYSGLIEKMYENLA